MTDGSSGSSAELSQGIEESAEELYEHAPCGYISTSEDGTIVRVNGTFLRWTGYSRDDLVERRRFQELLSPGGRIYHETHIAPMLRMQGRIREIAVEVLRSDGRAMPALLNSVLVRDRDGNPMAIRTMVFDATERRRYEEELVLQRKRAEESEAQARILAQTLQQSLLPTEPSQIPGLEVAARYLPAGENVGGDFYDVFQARSGDWVVFVGDVSGKGVEAARVTAAARYTLRATAIQSTEPLVLLGTLNEALLAQEFDRHCTVAYARLESSEAHPVMTVASGGHPLPLVRSRTGEVRTLGRPGTILGAFDDIQLDEDSIAVEKGMSVMLYTDGVTEARSPKGEFFGEERLIELFSRNEGSSASGICQAISDAVAVFQGEQARDDIALLVIHRPT